MAGNKKISSKTDTEVLEMKLKNIKEMGVFSFELEEKREASLMKQSASILTSVSIFAAMIFFVAQVVIEHSNINPRTIFLYFFILTVLLLASLMLSIFAQWRYKYQTVQNIIDIDILIEKDKKAYKSESDFIFLWKDQIGKIQNSKKLMNDKRANLIVAAMSMMIISIIAFAVLMIYIIHIMV